MKLLSTVLALFVLISSMVPCLDSEAESAVEFHVQLELPDTDDQANEELCSPFCTCSCCISTADVYSAVTLLTKPSLVSRNLLIFNHTLMSNSGISFWQPPRA